MSLLPQCQHLLQVCELKISYAKSNIFRSDVSDNSNTYFYFKLILSTVFMTRFYTSMRSP